MTALGRVVSHVDRLASVTPLLEQLGRDHRRFSVSRDHYPRLARRWWQRSSTSWAVMDRRARGRLDRGLRGRGRGDGHGRRGRRQAPPWYEAAITGFERRTASVAVLRLTPDTPIPYRPGQSVAVETAARPRLWRYYTPATLPDPSGSFELHVRAVGGGPVSTALVHGSHLGDLVRCGAPVGQHLTLIRRRRWTCS